jgi:hypothetical protein
MFPRWADAPLGQRAARASMRTAPAWRGRRRPGGRGSASSESPWRGPQRVPPARTRGWRAALDVESRSSQAAEKLEKPARFAPTLTGSRLALRVSALDAPDRGGCAPASQIASIAAARAYQPTEVWTQKPRPFHLPLKYSGRALSSRAMNSSAKRGAILRMRCSSLRRRNFARRSSLHLRAGLARSGKSMQMA